MVAKRSKSTNQFINRQIIWYFIALLMVNLAVILPPLSPLRVAGAILLIGLLPGLAWSWRFFALSTPLLRVVIAAALSFIFATLASLLLHYLPGPIQRWQFLILLNGLALTPFLLPFKKNLTATVSPPQTFRAMLPLLFILLTALALRVTNLAYSEFQGDEALAMLSAAEALEGHEDALFLRAKGPGELLLPLAMWRLTGVINEPTARLPFAVASVAAIATIYLVGLHLGGPKLGGLAAGFLAFNGFMVAFGRIVQYQALVVWFSALGFLLMLHWRDGSPRQLRWPALAGLCLGTGLLAHYDAILVLPAIGWLLIGDLFCGQAAKSQWPAILKAAGVFILTTLLAALPFYLPFFVNPQANRTGEYVGGRIGSELRNNLPDFFHFNTFYSSFYFLILTGGLVLMALLWLSGRGRPVVFRWTGLLLVAGGLAVIINPNLLTVNHLNLAVIPFALLFAIAFLSTGANLTRQALVLWLAVPFLGYNFVVALGLTHIYTIVPAWSALAALGIYFLSHRVSWRWLSIGLTGAAVLQTIFLWQVFIQHDAPYRRDYPKNNPTLFWTPYNSAPAAGFFGFPHRAGWKTIGQKITDGTLTGDYGSNEEQDVTAWYTRGAVRACDTRPEFYFLAADLVDPVDVPRDIIAVDYQTVATDSASMQIFQQKPATLNLGRLDDDSLARAFDRSARSSAFARSAKAGITHPANFDNLIQLLGYNADLRRLYPGGRLPVTLYWQALAPVPVGYQVFVHLSSPTGPVAQADGVPVCWTFPTDRWQAGQIVADPHAINIPADLPPGDYTVEIGLYLPDTFERLNVLDVAGNPAGVSVGLTAVQIASGK
jgi:4-amino-4-deoxy-L-arabinose transferase-like glycosyltransferase